MKSLLPINNYEKSVIIGACAIHFNEPILHFAAHNLRKRLDTVTKNISREKSQWLSKHYPGDSYYPFSKLLLLFGAITGMDNGKIVNGIEKIITEHEFEIRSWLQEVTTIKSIQEFCDDLMWLCDNDIILAGKKRQFVIFKDEITNHIPHFQEYINKAIGHLIISS